MIYLLIIGVCFLIYALYEYRQVRIETLHYQAFNPHNPLPDTMKGKRFIFISDMQWDSRIRPYLHSFAQEIVDTINDLDADCVLIGGDSIHRKERDIFHYLGQIKAPIISVLGNHDYKDLENVKKGLQSIGTLLINDVVDYEGIQIVGVDDFREGNPELPSFDKNKYTILLSHNPDYCETLKDSFDMILSGHTHGGQITFFGLFAPVSNSKYGQKYAGGYAATPGGTVYVSSGLGGSILGFPIRFFARPSIQIIEY